jgi:heme A synthase
LAVALVLLVIGQIAVGFVNLALLAPVWIQLVHLLLADLVWLCLVILAAVSSVQVD